MSKEQKFDPLDAMLYVAAKQAGTHELEELAQADPTLKLSRRVKRRIIRRAKHNGPAILAYAKRAAMVALVVMSAGFMALLSVDAVRADVWNAVVEWYEKYFDVSYSDDAATAPEVILEYREPRGGVNEYTRNEVGRSEVDLFVEYTSEHVSLTYTQSILKDYDISISNNQSTVQNIEINGHAGICFKQVDMGDTYTAIVWNDGEYAYFLGGNLTKEQLIQIANTVR